MNRKKDLKYYTKVFTFSFIGLILYIIYLWIRTGVLDPLALGNWVYIPIVFTFITFIFDKSTDYFSSSQTKKLGYSEFVRNISLELKKSDKYTIEDFRKIRENQKFQKSLEQAYSIIEKGATDTINIQMLERKFETGTMEYDAVLILIEEIKKNSETF